MSLKDRGSDGNLNHAQAAGAIPAPTCDVCDLGGCKFLPLCESCEREEIIAATKHARGESVYSPLAGRWGLAGQTPPPEIQDYIEGVLADVVGGSTSSLTPGAGDATQGAKDAEPGTASDSPPPKFGSASEGRASALQRDTGNPVGAPDLRQESWKHMCLELIRDAAPSWIRETPKGEPCSECGKTEEEIKHERNA